MEQLKIDNITVDVVRKSIKNIHIVCDNRRHPAPFTITLLSTIKHQHNILWKKIFDIQTELPYICPVRKQCLIKPLLTLTMSPSVTASTGIDALSHAIEGMISKYMRRAVADGEDLEARYYMSMAATLCMMAMSTSGGSYSHSAFCYFSV